MPAAGTSSAARALDRQSLINDNLGLVHASAHRFMGRGIDYDDLYQAGCIGLIKAADGFEPERGLMFSTYAVPAIMGEMKRLFRDGGSVKIGRSLKSLALASSRERERFAKLNGREPTVTELAAALGVEPEEAAEAVAASAPTLSLTPVDEDDDRPQLDLPVRFEDEAIIEHIDLREAIWRLDEEEKQLLVLRYFKSMTQSQAACSLGMTQVQVSRREKKILAKLRGFLE